MGHRFNPENVQKLHEPKRQKLLPAAEIIRDFGIGRGDKVADLGAGSGYFTIPIAKETGEDVYAVDIEPKMLDVLKERATADKVENIRYVVSDLEKIPLDNNTVDKMVAAFVLHEVENLSNALDEMKRILKPGGNVLVLEWEAVDSEIGPPISERIPSDGLVETLGRHGFDAKLSHPSEAHYTVVLTPVS